MTSRRKSAQARRGIRTRQRLKDEETRTTLGNKLASAYKAGDSIRQLATKHRLAYGTVRTLLLEAGVELRTRGGPNHVRRESDGHAAHQ